MIKRVLVTGAAGFIASHLIELLLSKGISVIGVDNFDPFYDRKLKEQNLAVLRKAGGVKFSFYELDIEQKESLERITESFDAVLHIAGKAGVRPSIDNPPGYIGSNITGTQNILDFMKEKSCKKLVFASSSSIYGNTKKVPFSEDFQVDHPISPYAFTKKANELQIHTYHHLFDIDSVCLRFFTVYGPRQRPDLAIRKFFTLIMEDKAIDMYGDGTTGRDYTFVSDIVAGIFGALNYVNDNANVYEIVNIGNNSPVMLHKMIHTIYKACNKTPNINKLPMQAGDVEITYADTSKAERLFGYKPKVSFKEGINEFKNWLNTQ